MNIIPPNTAEWIAARRGILTASRMADAMPGKKGEIKAAGITLAYTLLSERHTGQADDNYVSAAMQWGIDNEAAAIAEYETRFGADCETAGLVMHPTIKCFGATPDRFSDLDGTRGIVEVKCPTTKTHLRYIDEGKLPDDYAAQVWTQLACTGLPWCDFVSFDPRVNEHRLRLFRVRVERDPAKVAEIEDAAKAFLAFVDEVDKRIREAA